MYQGGLIQNCCLVLCLVWDNSTALLGQYKADCNSQQSLICICILYNDVILRYCWQRLYKFKNHQLFSEVWTNVRTLITYQYHLEIVMVYIARKYNMVLLCYVLRRKHVTQNAGLYLHLQLQQMYKSIIFCKDATYMFFWGRTGGAGKRCEVEVDKTYFKTGLRTPYPILL